MAVTVCTAEPRQQRFLTIVEEQVSASLENDGIVLAAWGGSFQLAQFTDYYYGYCFDDGIDFTCYWYPAEDVDYVNNT